MNLARAIPSLACVAALSLFAGTTLAQDGVPDRAAGTSSATLSPAQAAGDSTYEIGPGDTLEVFVWRNPDLTATVPVRPDGKITTPLVTDMVAVGKTPTQLAGDIAKVLAEYVRSPVVDVIVTQSAHAFSKVQVIGQVKQPRDVPYRNGMTVLDAIIAVGGLSQFAAGNRARLIRKENGKQVELPIKLGRLMDKGDMTQNYPLKPGDVLVIPESRF